MCAADADAVARVADSSAGSAYYTAVEALETLARCQTPEGGSLAYVAEVDGAGVVGFRFTLAPGTWSHGRGRGLSPDRWPAPLARTGYFLSCFINPAFTGHGIGRRLAARSLDDLRSLGASAVIAHCWKESPHGSSERYLRRLGFVAVDEHPDYWIEVDYVCAVDGKPCRCTAVEMVLEL